MRRKNMKKTAALFLLSVGINCMTAQDIVPVYEFDIDVQNVGAPIQSTMYGIFFEDINFGADGGLYAELIKNRSFEFENPWGGWEPFGDVSIAEKNPCFDKNSHYAHLTYAGQITGTGLENEGFKGIGIKANENYDFSLYARTETNNPIKLRIELVNRDNDIYETQHLEIKGKDWKKYSVILSPKATEAKSRLRITMETAGTLDLEHISLFPEKTFNNRTNGLRRDLAQALKDLKPGIFRFPGGCIVEGTTIATRYQWKNTVGPLEARKAQRNLWGYHQSMGLGYFEYFQFCEDIGAEPLPVLAAGVPCQNSACHGNLGGGQQGGIPMSEMGAYIQDILDLIEWANGDAKKTKWGKVRAEAGHPKPFNLKYIGIGNEDLITDIFKERFTMIFNAIKEKYPEMIVVGTVGPFNEGTDYVEGWKLADKLGVPMVDEHYYQSPGWFLHNQDFYDKYDRSKKTRVYLGEYATHIPGRKANIETALTEALYLASLERNGDVVHMTSYAPLLAKERHTQWNPDLIYFNNREVKPTTGYYVQKLYGQNAGNEYLPSKIVLDNKDDKVRKRFASSIVRDSVSGDVIVKLVNLLPVEVNTNVDLSGIGAVQPSAKRTVLTGKPTDTPLPVEDRIQIAEKFDCNLPAYSFTVIRIQKAN
ncbi:MAG: alpha-L-arabinofuranosidase [Parabacteroides distasonis]|nr:alpha-L-arabinofuranosidase [Parabacteroides distasonis]